MSIQLSQDVKEIRSRVEVLERRASPVAYIQLEGIERDLKELKAALRNVENKYKMLNARVSRGKKETD